MTHGIIEYHLHDDGRTLVGTYINDHPGCPMLGDIARRNSGQAAGLVGEYTGAYQYEDTSIHQAILTIRAGNHPSHFILQWRTTANDPTPDLLIFSGHGFLFPPNRLLVHYIPTT